MAIEVRPAGIGPVDRPEAPVGGAKLELGGQMAEAGYSGTPLVRKLGIRPGMTCAIVDPPGDYRDLVADLPERLVFIEASSPGIDFIHLFVRERAALPNVLREMRGRIAQNGMIWVSWPKKASGVKTDLSGDVVRGAGLAAGLVDVKVCAVDETWSGLKFVIPKADRHGRDPA